MQGGGVKYLHYTPPPINPSIPHRDISNQSALTAIAFPSALPSVAANNASRMSSIVRTTVSRSREAEAVRAALEGVCQVTFT